MSRASLGHYNSGAFLNQEFINRKIVGNIPVTQLNSADHLNVMGTPSKISTKVSVFSFSSIQQFLTMPLLILPFVEYPKYEI